MMTQQDLDIRNRIIKRVFGDPATDPDTNATRVAGFARFIRSAQEQDRAAIDALARRWRKPR